MRKNMRNERLRLGLSTADVADRIGVHENAVQRWERGEAEPLGSNLIRLARLYECTPEFLLGITSDREGRAPASVN